MSCGKKWRRKFGKVYGIPLLSKNMSWLEVRSAFWEYKKRHHLEYSESSRIWNKYFKSYDDDALGISTYFANGDKDKIKYYRKRYGKRLTGVKYFNEGFTLYLDGNERDTPGSIRF